MAAQTSMLSSPNSLLVFSSLQAASVLKMPGWLSATHSSRAVCTPAQLLLTATKPGNAEAAVAITQSRCYGTKGWQARYMLQLCNLYCRWHGASGRSICLARKDTSYLSFQDIHRRVT